MQTALRSVRGLLGVDLVETAHSDSVSVDVNVPLQERNRLRQDIKACAHKIHKQDLVPTHDAKDALVVVTSALGAEIHDDTRLRVGLDSADRLAEAENVVLVGAELELSGQIAIVDHVEDPVGLRVDLNLAEVK